MKKCLKLQLALAVALGAATWISAQNAGGEQSPQTPAKSVVEAGKELGGAAAETTRDVVRGMEEAGGELGGALKSGGGAVAEQGRSILRETVIPALERTSSALPGVIKAIILLIAFWIVARLAGGLVTKLLGMTRLDNRAAQELGLAKMLQKPDGTKRSLEQMAGGLVKWVILLFGFIAFFNALNLQMVAGPLQNIVDKIVGVIPNLLKAAVILFVYWAVAALVKVGVTKGLGALKFDTRAAKYFPAREIKGEQIGPSAMLGRLLFYMILLFGIPPFLDALGQQSLVAPLQEMLAKTLAFLPNIIAAAIIVFVGSIVATIVRELTTNFLATVGADEGARKLGFDKVAGGKKLSGIAGLVAYFFILVPIIISAVDALQIKAIADPVKTTLEAVLAAVPAIIVAAVIVIVGYAIAKVVRGLVESLLRGIGFDALPDKIGLEFLKPRGQATLSAIAGAVVMAVILLLTAQQALASLGFEQLAALTDSIVRYLPHLAVGLVILFAALSLGKYVGGLVAQAASGSPHAKLLAIIARYAIIFLGAGMALDQLGVSEQIVITAVSAVLGGAALALGLAFGLGGKEKAREIIEKSKQ